MICFLMQDFPSLASLVIWGCIQFSPRLICHILLCQLALDCNKTTLKILHYCTVILFCACSVFHYIQHVWYSVYFTGVVANSGLIYVVGGDDGSSNLGSVECFDPKANIWTLLPSSMMTGRSYAGVTVIDRPTPGVNYVDM